MLDLLIPFPPSVNTYWNFRGARRFLTPKAVKFKAEVLAAFRESKHPGFGDSRLAVSIVLNPPDRRLRDIDNIAKSTLDALCQAGAFDDDSTIDGLLIVRREIIPGGRALVSVLSLDDPRISSIYSDRPGIG
jgi:crossover junction endodeoxyribonuclease RusA